MADAADQVVDFINSANRTALAQIGRALATEVGASLGVTAEQIAKTFENNTARHLRKETNDAIAAKMRQALLSSYQTSIEGNKVVASYRFGRNRLPGALGEALKSTALIKSSIEGIEFNSAVLTRKARHWARLNYGAAPRGTGGGQTFDLLGAQLSIASGPRPVMMIPPGVFYNARSGKVVRPRYSGRGTRSQFYPTRREPMRPTRGVRQSLFLDAALEVLAREVPTAYITLANRIVTEATPKKVQREVAVRIGAKGQ